MSQTTILEPDSLPSEQFETLGQQRYAATLGMWAFLATEVLFIGAIFVAFYVYRARYPDAFADGARELKWQLGTLNTVVLLTSSFTMALAVRAGEMKRSDLVFKLLLATIALGSLFLAIKFVEYGIEFHDKLVPGLNYEDRPDRPLQMKLFMSFYFALTGVHAIHMIVGVTTLAVLAWLVRRGTVRGDYHHPIEIVGLYWHFVDLVWVFVLPTLYLLRHP